MKEATNCLINVLLVDDDEVIHMICTQMLKKAGIEKVNTVLNGQQAIVYLEQIQPDLIFLDLNMPEMDGFEFLELVKIQKLCEDTYIVILTSSINPADKEKAFTFPKVIDYLVKPLTIEKIEKVLLKL